MSFNPKEHLRKVQGGKDYLDVVWRVAWFRDVHPDNRIMTELIMTEPSIVFRAVIFHEDGTEWATGHGSAPTFGHGLSTWKGREIEKAETAAIGRVLKNIGFATEYSYDFEEDNDGNHLADAPIDSNYQESSTPAMPRARKEAPTKDAPNPLDPDSHLGKGQDKLEFLKELSRPLYKSQNHQDNSIKLAMEIGLINSDMNADTAAAYLFMHRVEKDFGFSPKEIHAAFSMPFASWLKQHPREYAKAWEIAQNYAKQLEEMPE